MKNQTVVSGAGHLYLFALLLTFSLVQSAAAQPADNCSGPFAVSGMNVNSFSGTFVGPLDDIDMTTCGGVGGEGSNDVVMCFTPQNDCSPTITCTISSGGNVDMGIASGACSDTPSCMVGSTFTGNPTASSGAFPVMNSVQYCVYCQRRSGMGGNLTTTISSTDCGALPVELFSFSIEASGTDGQSPEEDEPASGGAVD